MSQNSIRLETLVHIGIVYTSSQLRLAIEGEAFIVTEAQQLPKPT